MNVLVISMFAYALEKQRAKVKEKMFTDDIEDYSIHAVKALPSEIEQKIQGRQYDYAYIDTFSWPRPAPEPPPVTNTILPLKSLID